MNNPEQSQFVAGNPKTAEFIGLATSQGLGRLEAANWALDVAEHLERDFLAALEAARFITDGIVEVDEVAMTITSESDAIEVTAEQITDVTETTPVKRIPIRGKREKVDSIYMPEKVEISTEQLETEVREALSDEFIKSIVDSKKQDVRIPSRDELQAAVEAAFSGVLNETTHDDFIVWEDELFSEATEADPASRPPTDEELANDLILRRRALFEIAKNEGKGLVGQIATFAIDRVHIARVDDTKVLDEIDRSGAAVIEARERLARAEEISDLLEFKAVRNLERALRNPLSGMSISTTDEGGHITGGNYYPIDSETREQK